MDAPSEIDTSSFKGLTRLFRFAVGLRKNVSDHAALTRLESRFGLAPYIPTFRGALEDFVQQLEGLEHSQRFTAVYAMVSGALPDAENLDDELVGELLQMCGDARISRFSFAPAILPCLLHAQRRRQSQEGTDPVCEIRYAGVGSDRELVAFTSLFLDLAVYVETNPPWDPDTVFDNGEPNFTPPELEIAFPPADFRSNSAPHLEASVRASKLPRAVDRGKFDLESVMLAYLCEAEGAALVFTSENFLSSTKQSRLLARQQLLDLSRVSQVTEFTILQPFPFAIELSRAGYSNENIRMVVTNVLQDLNRPLLGRGPGRPRTVLIPVDGVRLAGDYLKPSRYHGSGPVGGSDFAQKLANISGPRKHKLVDFFEVIRPKTTRDDPVGTYLIQEVRAGNISTSGEISGSLRQITVRSTLAGGLEEQAIKAGDILFAHRGAIGRVAYVAEANAQENKMWAGQTLMIFRARRKSSSDRNDLSCDPRVLFMYLLTSDVQNSWSRLATGDRSPAIPIGQIESFSLPENLFVAKKQSQSSANHGSASTSGNTDMILAEFQDRQDELKKMREIEESMRAGLVRVWDAAWSKTISIKG